MIVPRQFIFSVATLVLSGKYLERVWGRDGFIQFCLVTVVGSNIMAVAVNVIEHIVLGDAGMLLLVCKLGSNAASRADKGKQIWTVVPWHDGATDRLPGRFHPNHSRTSGAALRRPCQTAREGASTSPRAAEHCLHTLLQQLPMLYVTFSNVMVLLGYQSPFILIQFGWLVSWFYLRFIKQNEGMDFRGDRSETFAFSSWFPPFVQ